MQYNKSSISALFQSLAYFTIHKITNNNDNDILMDYLTGPNETKSSYTIWVFWEL